MDVVRVTLPDGSVREVARGTTIAELVQAIGPGLAKAALAAQVDGVTLDLGRKLEQDCALRVLTWNDAEGRAVFRHSSTHLMAQAIKRLFPEAKLTVGPALEDGYFYDIDTPRPLTPEDFPAIEAEMQKIVDANFPIRRYEVDRAVAKEFFQKRGEEYKVLLVDDIAAAEAISMYEQGEFTDLCYGPHLPATGKIKAFKLMSVAGAYWRGDQKNKQLQRLYGTSFEKPADLERHLFMLEEAKKRDHRKLGQELDLFSFHEEAPGQGFWHNNGWAVYRALENWSRSIQERHGYQEVATPWWVNTKLYETSGHMDYYRPNLFLSQAEEQLYTTKPMNCPCHCLLFKEEKHSYRDLPVKIAEYGPLSRFEPSGTLHGLMRVRGFHQDDAHLFIREDQIEEQMREVLGIVDEMYGTLGMAYTVKLSTRDPDNFMGDVAVWDHAEATLAKVLTDMGRAFQLNPKDAAFYGPKLDFDVTDALSRKWQCATVQLDFQLPIKFDLSYVDADGKEKRPVMIHRAIMGSLERFIGVLTEHFAGNFPAWLAPVQVRVLPITERHMDYAVSLAKQLASAGLRVWGDARNEKMGYKIRDAELKKVPYIVVVGDKEQAAGTVALRRRGQKDEGSMALADFIALAQDEINGKKFDEAARKSAAGERGISA